MQVKRSHAPSLLALIYTKATYLLFCATTIFGVHPESIVVAIHMAIAALSVSIKVLLSLSIEKDLTALHFSKIFSKVSWQRPK